MIVMSFFFKQKTAYEMRISDWSSDVCSSDLPPEPDRLALGHIHISEEHAIVGLVHAELLLDRPRGKPDLASDEPAPRGECVAGVQFLHRTGPRDATATEAFAKRGDRSALFARRLPGAPLGWAAVAECVVSYVRSSGVPCLLQ